MMPLLALIAVSQCLLAAESAESDRYGGVNQCGLYSLQMAAGALGMQGTANASVDWNDDGELVDLNSLRQLAHAWGMSTRALKHPQRQLAAFPAGQSAAIIQVVTPEGRPHFIAALEARADKVLIADFPHAPFWYSQADLQTRAGWNGVALHVARTDRDLPRPDSLVSREVFWAALGLPLALLTVAVCRGKPRRRRRAGDRRPVAVAAGPGGAIGPRSRPPHAMPVAIAAVRAGAGKLRIIVRPAAAGAYAIRGVDGTGHAR
jgi:hypothetical protein